MGMREGERGVGARLGVCGGCFRVCACVISGGSGDGGWMDGLGKWVFTFVCMCVCRCLVWRMFTRERKGSERDKRSRVGEHTHTHTCTHRAKSGVYAFTALFSIVGGW